MGYTIKRFDTTPNPNALKCILDRRISEGPRSFLNAEMAADDPLARTIFEIEGVTNILMNGDWITISKSADADWKSVKSEVMRVLGEAP